MDYILALDAGTGSVRAVLFDLSGRQVGVAQTEWTHKEDEKYPDSMDFDYQQNWVIIKDCIRSLLKETDIIPSDIRAISATSMREGFVLYDADGIEIWACANVDARAAKEAAFLKAQEGNLEQMTYQLSGQTFALSAIPRLLWLKNHEPRVYEKATTLTMINDWILYKLSGELHMDPSNGCTSGIFDIHNRSGSRAAALLCGIKSTFLPEIKEAGTVIGYVTKTTAASTGLAEGTPVLSGGGDAQMASVGVGAIDHEQTVISGGSFWQQEVNINKPRVDTLGRIRVNCHAVPNLWQIETIAFSPGLVMRWFRDAFCTEEKAKALKSGRDPYEILEEKARNVPIGSNGIMPIFSNIMNFTSWRHASPSFINLSLDPQKSGKKELFKSLQENAALVTLGNLKLVEEETGFYPKEVIFTGGASKGKLWSQTLADVLGVSVKVPVVKEAAALGTALYAGVGVQLYSSISEAVKTVKWERIHLPNMTNHKQYLHIYQQWLAIYNEQLRLADNGLTKHMWKAPGV